MAQERAHWAYWTVRVPRALDAATNDLMRMGRIASKSILVRSVLDRLHVWVEAGYLPRMPLDWSMEQVRAGRMPASGLDAPARAALVAQVRASWPYDMSDRVRWPLTIPPDLDAFAGRLIAEGYYTSLSDLTAQLIAWRWRGVRLGYPVRPPIEYTPEQAANPANRVTPHPLPELPHVG